MDGILVNSDGEIILDAVSIRVENVAVGEICDCCAYVKLIPCDCTVSPEDVYVLAAQVTDLGAAGKAVTYNGQCYEIPDPATATLYYNVSPVLDLATAYIQNDCAACCGVNCCDDGVCCWSDNARLAGTFDFTATVTVGVDVFVVTGTVEFDWLINQDLNGAFICARWSGAAYQFNVGGATDTPTIVSKTFDVTKNGVSITPDNFGVNISLDIRRVDTAVCASGWQIKTAAFSVHAAGVLISGAFVYDSGVSWTCISGDCSGFSYTDSAMEVIASPDSGPTETGSGSGTLTTTATSYCCKDLDGNCISGTPDTDGSCLIAP